MDQCKIETFIDKEHDDDNHYEVYLIIKIDGNDEQ